MNVKKILSIAGSDCSGGAGIQADLKTISAHKMYGMSVITSVTAQNTTGVYGVFDVESNFVGKQIDCVFEDIRPDAVKVGMVSNVEIILNIANHLKKHKPEIIVVDPVMVSTSGCMLLEDSALDALISNLIPIATLITPNIMEAEVLSSIKIKDHNDMVKAAKIIYNKTKSAVLIKGGHLAKSADDLLYCCDKKSSATEEENIVEIWFEGEKIDNPNTHGTGCTLSSAIACNLAKGYDIVKSVKNAKNYISQSISVRLDIGEGDGPLWHFVEVDTNHY